MIRIWNTGTMSYGERTWSDGVHLSSRSHLLGDLVMSPTVFVMRG